MRKHVIAALAVSTLLLTSVQASAKDVAEDMDTMAEQYKSALGAKDSQAFKTALTAMRAAALDAQQGVPPKLEGEAADSASMKDYRHGYDVLVGQIDAAIKLADEGKLTEAQAAAEGFKATRNEYHKKFR